MEPVLKVRDPGREGGWGRVREELNAARPVLPRIRIVLGQSVVARDKGEEPVPAGAPVLGAEKEGIMPGGDRTGPLGEGPMTGRGLGHCGGFAGPGFAQGIGGRGRGFGRARGFSAGGRGGRGWRNIFRATGVPGWARGDVAPAMRMNERHRLEARAEELEREIAGIRAQLDELAARERQEQEGAGE